MPTSRITHSQPPLSAPPVVGKTAGGVGPAVTAAATVGATVAVGTRVGATVAVGTMTGVLAVCANRVCAPGSGRLEHGAVEHEAHALAGGVRDQ